MSSTPSRLALILGFTTIYVVWGSTYLGIRIAVETLPPFLMAAARFLVAGAIIAAFISVTRGFRATRKQWIDNSIIGALLLLGGNGLVSWAEQKIPSGIATLMVSVGPLFIVLLDWGALKFFNDGKRGSRPNLATFAGIALGFAGLVLLVGPDVLRGGTDGLDPARIVGLIFACLFWSAGSLYTRYASAPAEPFTGAAIQMLMGSVWLLLVSVARGELTDFSLAQVSANSVWAWAYLIVFGSLIGFTTFVWLMKHSTPSHVATYAYVNPVVAVFLGWLILKEPIGPRTLLASAIIIAGVAIITVAKNKKTLATPPRQAVAAVGDPDRAPAK
ncbi:MAG: EamA family transporter [Candidatus Didemnitutus sp.]|nr:EamA family transporter [Candidatus Didemnitutus sp.]